MISMGGLPCGFAAHRNKEENPYLSASRHPFVKTFDGSRALPGRLRRYLAPNGCKTIQKPVSAVFTCALIHKESGRCQSAPRNPALGSAFPAGRLSREFAP
jgi:hypothetical protein